MRAREFSVLVAARSPTSEAPQTKRNGAYTATALLSSLGVVTSTWQVGALRAGAWTARGRLLADVVPLRVNSPPTVSTARWTNLGAIGGPLYWLGDDDNGGA